MANLTLSHAAGPRHGLPSETTTLVAALVVVWFAIVVVLGARGAFITAPGVPPLPILLGFLTPLVVFSAAYWLSPGIREFVLTIDPRLMMAIPAWRFAGLGFLALYAHGVLPGFLALPAGFGDIAVGVTAPVLLAVLMRQPSFAGSSTFVIWNLLGILDLLVALGTGALGGILAAGADGGVTTGAMAQMPLVLIPAFFVPIFFALHAAALLQARRLAATVEQLRKEPWLAHLSRSYAPRAPTWRRARESQFSGPVSAGSAAPRPRTAYQKQANQNCECF